MLWNGWNCSITSVKIIVWTHSLFTNGRSNQNSIIKQIIYIAIKNEKWKIMMYHFFYLSKYFSAACCAYWCKFSIFQSTSIGQSNKLITFHKNSTVSKVFYLLNWWFQGRTQNTIADFAFHFWCIWLCFVFLWPFMGVINTRYQRQLIGGKSRRFIFSKLFGEFKNFHVLHCIIYVLLVVERQFHFLFWQTEKLQLII